LIGDSNVPNRIDPELIAFSEEHRALLPDGFAQEVDSVESALASGRTLEAFRTKGKGIAKKSNAGIRAAILDELSLYLCTDHPRYAELRSAEKTFTKQVMLVVAGVIAATVGISTAVATACVSFLALACLRIGVATFCRLNPPPAEGKKSPGKAQK